MWALRPSDADWAMAGPFLSACVMSGNIRSYWANGRKYPVPWYDVEKVCICYLTILDDVYSLQILFFLSVLNCNFFYNVGTISNKPARKALGFRVASYTYRCCHNI